MNEESITVLAVDDNRSERYLVKSRLSKWGYRVLEAASAEQALDVMAKLESPPDLIVSDQVMPDMDGIGLLRRVRKAYPYIPFVMLTGHGSIDKAVASMKQGADDYLIKPVRDLELRRTVRRCLKLHRLSLENEELKDYLNDL